MTAFTRAHPKASRLYARRFRNPSDLETTTLADYADKVLLVAFRPKHP